MNIVCIGSHPDDVELAMSGTILRMKKKGHSITIVDLSNGEPTPFGTTEIRQRESAMAAELLDINRITLSNKNRFIFDTIDARSELAAVFREIKPNIIFTHFEFDVHPDHVNACKISEGARFYSKLTKSDIPGEPFFPSKIVYYFPNHIHINLLPTFCVDISGEILQKEKILKCYDSQFIKKGNGQVIDEIIHVNRYFGIRIQKKFAEPFFLRDSLDLDFFKDLV